MLYIYTYKFLNIVSLNTTPDKFELKNLNYTIHVYGEIVGAHILTFSLIYYEKGLSY